MAGLSGAHSASSSLVGWSRGPPPTMCSDPHAVAPHDSEEIAREIGIRCALAAQQCLFPWIGGRPTPVPCWGSTCCYTHHTSLTRPKWLSSVQGHVETIERTLFCDYYCWAGSSCTGVLSCCNVVCIATCSFTEGYFEIYGLGHSKIGNLNRFGYTTRHRCDKSVLQNTRFA